VVADRVRSDGYYRFFPGDYLRDTADLSLVEHGAYRVLLDVYYSDGRLPAEQGRLYRICRATTDDEKAAVDLVVDRFFYADGDRLFNRRADREIAARRDFIGEQTRKAKKGAEARWKTRRDALTMPAGMPGAMPGECPGQCPDVWPEDAPASASALEPKDQKLSSESDDPESPTGRTTKRSDNGKATPDEIIAFFDLWNTEAVHLPKARELNESRRRKIRARRRERSLVQWREVFRRMNQSAFLRGEVGNGTFRADLDWIIANQGNAVKVSEGRYDDRPKSPLDRAPVSTTGRPLEQL
jgi:uncharacterized protein YdaU (DUF1376 family)